MKILLTGKHGQLGWELQRSLQPLGEVCALDRTALDLTRPETIAAVVGSVRPDVIVNAAAYTAVDRAETEEALATTVNGVAVGELAEAARKQGAQLLHYSTDYVFDGEATLPYREDNATNPRSAYGRSKVAGEQAIAQVGGDWLIFRTSWVYGARGRNFMRTIANASLKHDTLRVVADQYGTPTSARLLADLTGFALRDAIARRRESRFPPGIYHVTAGGYTSWHTFAESIVDGVRGIRGDVVRTRAVEAITTDEFGAPAPRPRYSVLDCGLFDTTFALNRPDWQSAFELVIADYFR
ncbi:dTDP-4-dehydrorhamnose reductase [Burkholderia ubonensis]|uniref:dTDP-4-dehydrorhamnose reductase n=1 Tax=Burkholderia ubonensis TaxID=101571 RepID=UPI00075A38FF|nr:dTDP-4-dehydrorhamnose reductase [Burkholderia ubonensis]KVM04170.1 dTDP-4-dehydrorhamnose reductase [Burkholderia ubonensis]KVM17155.1 dTDP-4-dehydrorhamnose reductase [Burkholderia ubonensis]KVM56969.1 dTDP-4-dehydrorhamnose reductase [Burkholderia ubonensis]KVO31098.1 dTDP-4-dehydrorhamnose reductase [Burkholderia ubonensis]KVO83894.1 dTDP-4-dehydrorhamnose reductase [Burkholderia ubonensis]